MSGKVGDNLFRASGVIASSAADAYDDDQLQSNIAMLGFKVAVNGSLTRYNLVDQSIDEYFDTSGVDASASINEARSLSAPYYYFGGTVTTPSVTEDADVTGTDGLYSWYKWTDTSGTGSYDNDTTQDHEYLIVGGGGAGAKNHAGSGGAGGLLTATGLSLTGGNAYTVTIGAGGAAVTSASDGNYGSDSILSGTGITTLTAGGGGGGGDNSGGSAGLDGRATNGNGGGGAYNGAGGAGDGAGFDGGTQSTTSPQYGTGGGGGAGGAGGAGTPTAGGAGGIGLANDILETGTDVYYAGGGGGASYNDNAAAAAGGIGGGGAGSASGPGGAGTANTGGGGGGVHNSSPTSGAGGSGIVILRRLTSSTTGGSDLTLQSTDVSAEAEPDYGEIVLLMEDGEGTATLNTDIKGYISRDSGTTFTQGTFVDEGTWGTDRKILAFHDLDISAQPSGTSMCYKVTTHNQSEGSKETNIYATSIGWR